MVQRNSAFKQLEGGYLFPEIEKRKRALLEKNPTASLISLGIGDTTLPLAPHVAKALEECGKEMGTEKGYRGYGPSKGDPLLCKKLSERIYQNRIPPEDIFITDGAKCDIARLQLLFPEHCRIAIQDPAYPVYADTSIMTGKKLYYLPCTIENNFFPKPSEIPDVDVLIICSPNNPTGAAATREQLQEIVDWAKRKKAILVFDAAYSAFIQDPSIPRSIFEIEGAKEVAIEMNSFSKMAGFTGVRLSWTALSDSLLFEDGTPVKKDWSRILNTCFNGASVLSQKGAHAVLDPEYCSEIQKNISIYLDNAKLIQGTLGQLGLKTFGGKNIPYVWAHFPGQDSWKVFDEILERHHVVTTPGSGFGPSGEGYVRFSAFGKPENVKEACNRLLKSGLKL